MPEFQPARTWPQTPVSTKDNAVDSLLEVLTPLSGQPAAAHAAVYAELHDALLTELNAEPPAGPPAPGDIQRTAG